MSAPAVRARPTAAAPTPETSGLLAVDKPAGPTSHDVVARVRRVLPAPGAGHLGTLDPPATGLLLVAIGAATRCVPLWQSGEKTYEAVFHFGVETSTDDLAGEVRIRRDPAVDPSEIRAASRAFVGEIEQIPPMVSAIKLGGRRLHQLARLGHTVERAPRRVRVSEWTWTSFELPEARALIRCSGGTYVRALARDLGRALGCGAALGRLRRLRSEPFSLERSITLADLDRLTPAEIWGRAGIPLTAALAHLAARPLDPAEARAVGHGNPIRLVPGEVLPAAGGAPILLTDAAGTPLALADPRPERDHPDLFRLQPRIVFPWAVREGAA